MTSAFLLILIFLKELKLTVYTNKINCNSDKLAVVIDVAIPSN